MQNNFGANAPSADSDASLLTYRLFAGFIQLAVRTCLYVRDKESARHK
jgi:hypothetical protein